MSSTAYLSLSSYHGDRAANLLRALSALVMGDIRLSGASSLYETEMANEEPDVLSLVIAVTAPRLEPFSLLNYCLATETRVGRKGMMEHGIRPVEIDLLLLDEQIVEETRNGMELILPHPYLHRRRSNLMPLAEVAPHLKHPLLGETMEHLLGAVADTSAVRVYRG